MALQSVTRLGPYEITAQIGEGGMGEEYQARDSCLDRTIAITIPLADVAAERRLGRPLDRKSMARPVWR